ncbi:hypothetical protein RHMOL_Rhmol12G0131600 [Rhododendron molle]|uniref:Uncharacterized protein n=1 Tax=Rhododendron molle TaxID=49168 RepID=A0ACC0LHV4_RHOML|nr:hypothetical protein RHMOL_Rhmol12G0131600 [Rhododendron molle]
MENGEQPLLSSIQYEYHNPNHNKEDYHVGVSVVCGNALTVTDSNVEVSSDLPPKPIPSPAQQQSEEESTQKLPPNKLVENIMKCLIFIFVRLLRT